MFGKGIGIMKKESDPLLTCFQILTLVGCWAIKSTIKWRQILYRLYTYFVITGFTVIPILEIIDIINVRHDIDKLNYTLTASSGTIMLIFKLFIILRNREQLCQLQKDLSNSFYLPFIGKNREDRKIAAEYDDTSRKILKIYFLYLGVPAVTTWCIIPAIDSPDGERITPMRVWLPFDFTKTPIYETLWAYQCFMLYMYCGAIITIDFMFFCILPKFCAQFDILKKNLNAMSARFKDIEFVVTERQEEATFKSLKQITVHHEALLRRCRTLNGIYRIIVYIHFFGMAVLMCSTIFDIVLVPKSKLTLRFAQQIQYFTAGMIDTYIYCYHGNRLINRGDEFAEGLYDLPWYHMSTRCKKLVLQMLLNAKKPPAMSGGGRFEVNNETFLAVCKLSYNILAILQNMQATKS